MAKVKKEPQEPTRRSERVQVSKAITKSKQELRRSPNPRRSVVPVSAKVAGYSIYPASFVTRSIRLRRSKGDLDVMPKGPGQPALLSVCRSIRREALSIYYRGNAFWLHVEDYDGAAFVPFHSQARPYIRHKDCKMFYCADEGEPNWDNLVGWLKAYDQGQIGAPSLNNGDNLIKAGETFSGDDFLFSAALKVMDTMAWLPWQCKEEYLTALYRGLRGTNSEWVKEEDRIPPWRW